MMKLFDSHCHLDDHCYDKDIDRVIKRQQQAGVAAALIAGVNLQRSAKAIELAERFPGIYAAVGLHPHDARDGSPEILNSLKHLAQHPKVKAWGEIGLDFNRMYSPRGKQEQWMLRQIEAATALQLPMIFHERDSQGRFLEILTTHRSNDLCGVIHCFSGNRQELHSYLNLGLYIGITGIVTMQQRGQDLRRLVADMPVDKILIETDAPYLTPAPEKNRVRRNEPAFVKSVLLKLADVLNTDPQIIAEQIWANTCRVYNIESQDLS